MHKLNYWIYTNFMDNLPNDPPDQNNSSPWGNPSTPEPSPSDPIIQAHSETAKHEPRDEHGRFTSENPSPNPPNTQNHPNFPLPVSFTQNTKYSERNDPPLVSVSVTNPITYLKLFLKRLLRNEGITIKIKPLTAITMILALSTSFGTGFNVAKMFFPNSSPLLHRAITLQGTVQMSESGQYYLSLPDNTLWTLRPTNPNLNLQNVVNKQVLVKGNMTSEPNVIEVKEVIAFDKPTPIIYTPTPQPATNSARIVP